MTEHALLVAEGISRRFGGGAWLGGAPTIHAGGVGVPTENALPTDGDSASFGTES